MHPATSAFLFLLLLSVGCGRHAAPLADGRIAFAVVATAPGSVEPVPLDEPVAIVFNAPVDLATVGLDSIVFEVRTAPGAQLADPPAGSWSLDAAGRLLRFHPRLPVLFDRSDAGYHPDSRYTVRLGPPATPDGPGVRAADGRPLDVLVEFTFQTRTSGSGEPFTRRGEYGPRVMDVAVSSMAGTGVSIGRWSRDLTELRVRFDRPVDPGSIAGPAAASDPLVTLEYADPLGVRTFAASIDLESNTHDGALVSVRPDGVLPNNAHFTLRVDARLGGLGGGDNTSDPGYESAVFRFFTERAPEPRFDAYVQSFTSESALDPSAGFVEPAAQVVSGRLEAQFGWKDQPTHRAWRPTHREVILDTDRTMIEPEFGPAVEVRGGEFHFDRVEIPAGVVVRAIGSRPLVFVVHGDFIVDGELRVDGAHAPERVVLGQYYPDLLSPSPGGAAWCGGGRGGAFHPDNQVIRGRTGEAGYGPGGIENGGGAGGLLSCDELCNLGSGGGGGSFTTRGDPFFPPGGTTGRPPSAAGDGGRGCRNASVILSGGAAGRLAFADGALDNDFWGEGFDPFRGIRIVGELSEPRGGSGGGGGGGRSIAGCDPTPYSYFDGRAGGGGGGGGVLIVKCLGTIRIGSNGRITADGGHGAAGDAYGGNTEAGGGGGGSGGMVVLMAGAGIEIHAHGGTYVEADCAFAVSADGGVSTLGSHGLTRIDRKYPPVAVPVRPMGGFGGMGLIQFHVPAGDDADGTGCRLDDHIHFFESDAQGRAVEVSSARKLELLGWRGWIQPSGERVDDHGRPVARREGEGDIRPSPVLLPVPFDSVSRARSRWIDLGAIARRRVDGPPAPGEHTIVVAPRSTAPLPDLGDSDLGLADIEADGPHAGFLSWDASGARHLDALTIDGLVERAIRRVHIVRLGGSDAYQVDLALPLGATDDRYVGYRLELIDHAGRSTGAFRILAHDGARVFVSASAALSTAASRARVLARFVALRVDGDDSLGPSRPAGSGTLAPATNLRLGFAFSSDLTGDPLATRWPPWSGRGDPNFETDLRSPLFLDWLRRNAVRFVQWDVTFFADFDPTRFDHRGQGGPIDVLPRMELDGFVLPLRF